MSLSTLPYSKLKSSRRESTSLYQISSGNPQKDNFLHIDKGYFCDMNKSISNTTDTIFTVKQNQQNLNLSFKEGQNEKLGFWKSNGRIGLRSNDFSFE
jgi:hypothetical protein